MQLQDVEKLIRNGESVLDKDTGRCQFVNFCGLRDVLYKVYIT